MKIVLAVLAVFVAMAGVAQAQVGSYWIGQAWHTGGVQDYQSKPNSVALQSWVRHGIEIQIHICDLDGSNCHRSYVIRARGRYDLGMGPNGKRVFLFHAANATILDYKSQQVCSQGNLYAGGDVDGNAYVVETYFNPARCTAPLPGRQFIHVRLDTTNCTTYPPDTCPWVAEISLER